MAKRVDYARLAANALLGSGKIFDLEFQQASIETASFSLMPGVRLPTNRRVLYYFKDSFCGNRCKVMKLQVEGLYETRALLHDLEVCFCKECRQELVRYTLTASPGDPKFAELEFLQARIKYMKEYAEKVQEWVGNKK